jgi:hypothetical protein
MANITGDPLAKWVQNQIKLRQQIIGNNPEVLTLDQRILYNNNRNAWVRLASSVDLVEGSDDLRKNLNLPNNSGDLLAKNFVLFGGIYSIDNSYSRLGGVVTNQAERDDIFQAAQYSYGLGSSEYGYVPMPGLDSVKITHVNRGAIRNYDIQLTAHNKDQLEIIEALYLRIGYYMLLEWGHTNYVTSEGEFVPNPEFYTPAFNAFFEKGKKDSDVEININEYRKTSGGNYDGALIKITNFSWDFNSDGSYGISLKGVSKGGIIDSLVLDGPVTLNDTLTNLADYKIVTKTSEEKVFILKKLGVKKGKDENIDSVYNKTIANNLSLAGGYEKLIEVGAAIKVDPSSINPPTTLDVKSSLSEIDDNSATVILDQNKSVFNKRLFSLNLTLKNTKWSTKDKINYKKSSLDNRTEVLTQQGVSSLSELVSIKFINPENDKNAFEFNYITLGGLLEIIKQEILPHSKNGAKGIKVSNSYDDNYMFTHFFQHSTDPEVCLIPFGPFANSGVLLKEILSNSFRVENNPYAGRLMAIHVNLDFIAATLADSFDPDSNQANLYTFLDKLVYGIQNALGNINNFLITFDDENGIQIKDDTIIPGVVVDDPNEAHPLRLYGVLPNIEGSFTRNVSIQSEITNKLVTQISIGSTASNNSANPNASLLARWNEGLLDRIQNNTNNLDNVPDEEFKKDLNKQFSDHIEKFLIPLYRDFKYPGKDVLTSASRVLSLLLEYDLGIKTINGNIPGKGFIPVNLSIGLDGISGILPYQRLIVTNEILPKNYANKIDFIVQGIDNTIQNNTWTTTLNTLSVAKKSDKTKNIQFKDDSEFSISIFSLKE